MPKIAVIGGKNPHPDTFGRRQWLGPWAYHFMANNKKWPSGDTIPVNPVYSNQGIGRNGYWTEHGPTYYDIEGNNIHSQEGITVKQKSGAHTESRSALFIGCSPKDLNFKADPICPMFRSNNKGTPGIVAMSFDWDRYDRRDDSHRNRLWKVGFMIRDGENSVGFADCSYKASHEPPATGDLRIFDFRGSGSYQEQHGSVYCPVRYGDHEAYEKYRDVGAHNVVGVAIQYNKEGGFNPEQNTQTGSYITIRNLKFHTQDDKEVILPRKQVYPVHNQHPTGKAEIYTY